MITGVVVYIPLALCGYSQFVHSGKHPSQQRSWPQSAVPTSFGTLSTSEACAIPKIRTGDPRLGFAGHVVCARPESSAPVPIAVANREAFNVLLESASVQDSLLVIEDTRTALSKLPSFASRTQPVPVYHKQSA